MSEILNLNGTSPAAPTGAINVTFQLAGSSSSNDATTGLPIFAASAYYIPGLSTALITMDGGGVVPSTGVKGFLQIPFPGTITGWALTADQSGSASIDVWALAGSAPPTAPSIPSSGNKISASAPCALSSAQSAAGGSSAISTWTTAISQWMTIAFNLSSVTTCTRLTLQIYIQRA